jgi:nucleotide-binding universal stress UspA family protein
MFSKIIVGVDGREGGRDALALGARLASVFGGELVAVHSDAVPDASPGRALHLAAKRHHGDIIVVGSADRGVIARVRTGDATMGTLNGAECPVIVAPRGFAERGSQLRTIGVGFDGSPEAHAAAELARDLAAATGAQLKVIRALKPPSLGGRALGYDAEWLQRAEARRDEVEAELAALLAELGDIATGEVVVGDPATELAYAGNELDLLVTGSRSYGPVRRLMLGSTSAKLVREPPCPVLVLTRGDEAEAERAVAGAGTAATT